MTDHSIKYIYWELSNYLFLSLVIKNFRRRAGSLFLVLAFAESAVAVSFVKSRTMIPFFGSMRTPLADCIMASLTVNFSRVSGTQCNPVLRLFWPSRSMRRTFLPCFARPAPTLIAVVLCRRHPSGLQLRWLLSFIYTSYSCFVMSKSAASSRRSRAYSLESPYPAGPRNAVKRSTRKYHSAVTRNWLFGCQGEGFWIFAPHL